jgi:sugar phosphate isomerase/epimerase
MKLTMSGEVLSHTLPLEKAIEITKSYGIHNFELWAQNCDSLSSDCHQRLFKNRDIKKATKQLKESKIHVACVAFGGAFHQEITADEELYNQELIRAIEVAGELGSEYVNHYCNLLAPKFELDLDVLDRYYSRPLKRAEELGIILVLENEAHDMTHTPENVLEIINHFKSKNFRSNLDVTNFYQAGIEAFPYAYELLKTVIAYVHIKNGCIYTPKHGQNDVWKGGKMSGQLSGQQIHYTLPILGAVNIPGLLAQLNSDNYGGFVTLEPHSTLENILDYYKVAIPFIKGLGYFDND